MEEPLLQIWGDSPEEFSDSWLREAREGASIESNLAMFSFAKRIGLLGQIKNAAGCLPVYLPGRLGSDCCLITKHAPVRATLVRNKDRYD
jgi:hypothetical protein